MSPTRIWAIVVVALLHVLLGFALVYGLYTRTIKETQEDLSVFDVDEPPPPEPPPPPPPPQTPQPQTPQQVVIPQQIVQQQTPTPTTTATPTPQPPVFTPLNPPPAPPAPPTPPAPPPPPPPPPPPASPPSPAVQTGGSISDADYPASAIRAEASGTTRVSIQVGANGRVAGCSVTGSSGNAALDQTACRLIQSRFRYRPATQGGQPVATTMSRSITWRLPRE
jgi:protein TonB